MTNDIFAHPLYAPAVGMAEALKARDRLVLLGHVTPDGDAIGSMYALGFALRALGKEVALCDESGLPETWGWLPGPGPVYTEFDDVPFTPQTLVFLDCAEYGRLGERLGPALRRRALPNLVIDHHLSTPGKGVAVRAGCQGAWVEPQAAATGQLVAAIVARLGISVDRAMAEALYVAISSDSGSFAFDNVTPELFNLAAWLMRCGCNVPAVRRHMDKQWTPMRMRLWGELLQHFQLHDGERVALCRIPRSLLDKHGACNDDLEGLAEHLRLLKSVDVAATLREDAPGRNKLSLRSSGSVNVQAMAAHFGGGGHRNAAGATITGTLEEASQRLLDIVTRKLGHDAP